MKHKQTTKPSFITDSGMKDTDEVAMLSATQSTAALKDFSQDKPTKMPKLSMIAHASMADCCLPEKK